MSVETRTPTEVKPEANGGEKSSRPDDSLLGRIAAAREERVRDEHVLLGIPTWSDDLVAKFAVLGEPERETASKKLERGDDSLDFHVSVLSGACVAIYGRDPDSDELVQLREGDEKDGDPILFDSRLTDMFGVECKTVRDVLLYLTKDNRIALNAFGQKVLDWMTDTSREVEGALVGESLA